MKKSQTQYKIGEAARKTGISIHTFRYYEKIGLLRKPSRSAGGFRVYGPEIIERAAFIKKAQSFGLTLEEIKRIAVCGDKGLEPCCDLVARTFEKKIQEFETKIKELQKMKKELRRLLGNWAGK